MWLTPWASFAVKGRVCGLGTALSGFGVRWLLLGGADCLPRAPGGSLGHCQGGECGCWSLRMLVFKQKVMDSLWGLRTMGRCVQAGKGLKELENCGQGAAPRSRWSEAGYLLVGNKVSTVYSFLQPPSLRSGAGRQAWPLTPSSSCLSPLLLVFPCRKWAAACASGSGCTPCCGRAPSR